MMTYCDWDVLTAVNLYGPNLTLQSIADVTRYGKQNVFLSVQRLKAHGLIAVLRGSYQVAERGKLALALHAGQLQKQRYNKKNAA